MKNWKASELIERIEQSYSKWQVLHDEGGRDPFWPDGCNMKLVRNHIIYYKNCLLEVLKPGETHPLIDKELPPEVEQNYFVNANSIKEQGPLLLKKYEEDENYQFVLKKAPLLTIEQREEAHVSSVLDYYGGLKIAVEKEDLVVIRRHWKIFDATRSFKSCSEAIKKILCVPVVPPEASEEQYQFSIFNYM